MSEFIFTNEALIRIGVFGGVFCLIACAEWQWPRRVLGVSQRVRWQNNLGLGLLNTVLLRLIFPMAAVGAAAVAAEQGWGLFFFLGWSGGLAIGVAIVLLDFVVYLQHRVMHLQHVAAHAALHLHARNDGGPRPELNRMTSSHAPFRTKP